MAEEHLEIVQAAGGLVLRGDLDAHTASRLATAFDAVQADQSIEVDCQGLEFVDSSGIEVFVETHKRLRAGGGRLELRAPSPAVVRVLELTGLTDELHLT